MTWRTCVLGFAVFAGNALGSEPTNPSSADASQIRPLSAPLVAAEADLRAAAVAVRGRNWTDARELLRSAQLRIEPLLSTTSEGSRDALQSIVDEVRQAESRTESTQKPKAQEILNLAQRTRALKLG